MVPPPLYQEGAYAMDMHVINEVFPSLIPQIADHTGAKVIPTFDFLGGPKLEAWELFCDDQNCDACHPNDAGYEYLAARIYGQLFGKPMPQSGDVMLENPKLKVWRINKVI